MTITEVYNQKKQEISSYISQSLPNLSENETKCILALASDCLLQKKEAELITIPAEVFVKASCQHLRDFPGYLQGFIKGIQGGQTQADWEQKGFWDGYTKGTAVRFMRNPL